MNDAKVIWSRLIQRHPREEESGKNSKKFWKPTAALICQNSKVPPFTNGQIVASKIKHNLSNAMQRLTLRIKHRRDWVWQIKQSGICLKLLQGPQGLPFSHKMRYVQHFPGQQEGFWVVSGFNQKASGAVGNPDNLLFRDSKIFRAHCRFVKLPTPTN